MFAQLYFGPQNLRSKYLYIKNHLPAVYAPTFNKICKIFVHQTALTSLVKMLKSCPHLSQSSVELLLGQLHCACDSARVLMCQALAAIATQQPVLAEGMLGNLLDLFSVASHRTSEKQQELLVHNYYGEQLIDKLCYVKLCDNC